MYVAHALSTPDKRGSPSGGDRLGTDEETFKYYLTHENYAQLALIFSQYERLAGEAFSEALEDEFSRHTEDAVLAIGEGDIGEGG